MQPGGSILHHSAHSQSIRLFQQCTINQFLVPPLYLVAHQQPASAPVTAARLWYQRRMLQWLSADMWRRVIEGRGQRRREEVTAACLKGGRGGSSSRGVRSYSTTSCPSNKTTVPSREGGREGGGEWLWPWLITAAWLSCLFTRDQKMTRSAWKSGFICSPPYFFLCHVLSLHKDTFLSSMQIYSVWIFYDFYFFRLLTESAAHSWDFFSPFFFSGFCNVFRVSPRWTSNRGSMCAEGENKASGSTFMAEVRGWKRLNKRTVISHWRAQQFAAWRRRGDASSPSPTFQPALGEPDRI